MCDCEGKMHTVMRGGSVECSPDFLRLEVQWKNVTYVEQWSLLQFCSLTSFASDARYCFIIVLLLTYDIGTWLQ